MISEKVATYNAPQRAGERLNDRAFQRLANMGCTFLGGQEIPDEDAALLRPHGYRYWRPAEARSEVAYWDPGTWQEIGLGAFPISSPDWERDRFIVWVRLLHREAGVVRKFGALHMTAFKTRDEKHAREYRHQAKQVAEWMSRSDHRVLVGDFNGQLDSLWLDGVDKVANVHTPKTRSGPEGQFIDLILTSQGAPRAEDARALGGFSSDHKPVVARLPLPRLKER